MPEFVIFLGTDGRRRGVCVSDISYLEDLPVPPELDEEAFRSAVTLRSGKQFTVEGTVKQILKVMCDQAESESLN